jgi:Flp pilus assembly protein CpaB
MPAYAKPFTCRFDPDTRAALRRAAACLRLPEAEVVRLAVHQAAAGIGVALRNAVAGSPKNAATAKQTRKKQPRKNTPD